MEALRKKIWAGRLTWIAALLCFGSVLAALIGAIGSGRGAWHFRVGFKILEYALYAGVAGLVLALVALFMGWRLRPRLALLNLAAIFIVGGFLGFVINQIRIARSVPAIHDVATNLEDPPQFHRLPVREDNLESIPDLGRADLAAMTPLDRWKAIHREHYGDVATIRVPWSVEETVERARALAADRGWEIITADARAGIVEAVATSRFFRFKDNVVVRARPAGNNTIVDMRSISRVGGSDVGVNAARIREFLADLRHG